jgi:hypothetical protein
MRRAYILLLKRKNKVLLCEKKNDCWFITIGSGDHRHFDDILCLADVINYEKYTKTVDYKGERMANVSRSRFFGYTWVGWLNILILQWFFVRLQRTTEPLRPDKFNLLKWIYPTTGWNTDYKFLGKNGR